MPGVYSVFNIGTGHTQKEPNNTIAALGHDCHPDKWINDGPGGAFGTLFGKGMDSMCESTVKDILSHNATGVNLTGHSRGGVLCHMIANDLAGRNFPGEVNMIVLDPVNMSSHMEKGKVLKAQMKLGSYIAIVMENVTTSAFPLTAVQPLDKQFRQRMYTISMPGTHGSGTQCQSSAIGEAVFGMIRFVMSKWGTTFGEDPPTPEQLAEAFAKIHVENPVTYTKKGLVAKRLIFDDKTGMGTKITQKFQGVGRQKKIGGMLGDSDATDFRDSPYFFNEFHAACFRASFPALYERFAGDKSWWQTHANDPKHLAALNLELDEIEGGGFPFLNGSLVALGML